MSAPAAAAKAAAASSKTAGWGLFRPLSPSIAQTRFKANVFGLFLLWFFESVFTPYRTLRRGVIWFVDEKIQHRAGPQASWAGNGISSLETVLALILLWNIIEAGLALRYPTTSKFVPVGMQITPAKISSPLTRPYTPPTRLSTPLPASPIPMGGGGASSSMARLQTPSNNTPSRLSASSLQRTSSPLSASTAKILNLPSREANNSPNNSSGLFFNPDDTASPSKAGQPPPPTAQGRPTGASTIRPTASASVAVAGSGSGTTSDGEFVLVDRAEREWADNVWRGVRGKGGKIGI